MSKSDASSLSAVVSLEVECYITELERIRSVHDETKNCLNQVDYEHHFDQAIYSSSTWSVEEESGFQASLGLIPKFLILGTSSLAKAAVVNEILACPALPTVVPEESAESMEAGAWSPVVVKYGSCSHYTVRKAADPAAADDADLLSIPASPPDGAKSSLPLSAVRDGEEAVAEVTLHITHSLLKDGAEILVPAYGSSDSRVAKAEIEQIHRICCESFPLIIFVISTPVLTDLDIRNLRHLKQKCGVAHPIFFVKSRPYVRSDLPESDRYGHPPLGASGSSSGFVSVSSIEESDDSYQGRRGSVAPSRATKYLACFSGLSSDSESTESQASVAASPSRYKFGGSASIRQQLMELHLLSPISRQLCRKAPMESREPLLLSDLIERSRDFHRFGPFVQRALRCRLISLSEQSFRWQSSLLNLFILTAFDMARDQLITPKRLAFSKRQESELFEQLMAGAEAQHASLNASFSALLKDLLPVLSTQITHPDWWADISAGTETAAEAREIIERYVIQKVNGVLSETLAASLACLRQTYIGTLKRCLEKLGQATFKDETIQKESSSAVSAFNQLLNAAYALELNLPTNDGLMRLLWHNIKMLVQLLSGKSGRGKGAEPRDAEWRGRVVAETLERLDTLKPSKVLSAQLKDKIKGAHDHLHTALDKLEQVHLNRLTRSEEQRLALRKKHAPRLARLTMESLALKDVLNYGMPGLGPEIGRGQYGVVYACERWGKYGPCAVKSVVPPDDRHCNDLAMEFYYTKTLPPHDRVVRLHGAVMDFGYGGGGGQPAVLLVMERMKRDLYTAIRQSLNWPSRLQVALDVIEGMRFLHSQGLVHRDIKLKNVLLNEQNRGKITDLGFCKPEAMMSGSVVGTPIHMAPELFSGTYDASVDVYAFGVLFWYICAGHVRLPQAFEQCASKDQLWKSVKKGLRPEQLSSFDEQVWAIMRDCWSGDPTLRPHLGDLHPRLKALAQKVASSQPYSHLLSRDFPPTTGGDPAARTKTLRNALIMQP